MLFPTPIHPLSTFLPASPQSPGSSLSITAGRAPPRPLSGVTRAPSAVQRVDHAEPTGRGGRGGTDTFSLLGANTASIVKMNNLLHRDCLLTALSLFTFQLSNTLDGEPACQPFRRSPRAQPPGFSPQETVSISSVRSGSNYSCSVMTLSILS